MVNIMKPRILHATLLAGIASPGFLAMPLLAQDKAAPLGYDGVETIIVTAQRREESLQNVPIAITAVGGDELSKKGLSDIANLSKITPSLNVASYPDSSTTLTLNMRGQGTGDPGQITKDGGVGIYIDGFYIARPQAALFDIGDPERIEVLRGPQGTLYGRNTTGGAVNIITKKPTGGWGVESTLSRGNRARTRSLTTINLPEYANFSVKGTFLYSDRDGWVKNPGSNEFGDHGELAGRVAVRWKPIDQLIVDYAWDRGRVTSTQDYYYNRSMAGIISGFVADHDTASPGTLYLPESKANYTDHQLIIAWDVADSLVLKSLSSYRSFRSKQWSNYGYAFNTPEDAAETPFTSKQNDRYRTQQYSQELQFIGEFGDRFDYTGGLYFFHEKGWHHMLSDTQFMASFFDDLYTTDRMVHAKTTSSAAYVQGTWTPDILQDRLKLTVGGRYTHDKKKATRDKTTIIDDSIFIPEDVGTYNEKSFDNFSPIANIAYDWSDEIMTYVKVSKGYKSGGSSEGAIDFRETFDPEKVTSYEAGLKSQFFDRRVTLNAAVFWNKFNDMQIDLTADTTDQTLVLTTNAGKARVRGIELDLTFRPQHTLTLRTAYAYLDTKMTEVLAPAATMLDPDLNPDSPFSVGDNVASYFMVPFAPRHSFSLSGDWVFLELGDSNFDINAIYSYQSATPQSTTAGSAISGRKLFFNDATRNLDLRVSYNQDLAAGGSFSLTAFCNNVTDSRYAGFRVALGSPLSGYTATADPYNEPRTYGIEAKIKF